MTLISSQALEVWAVNTPKLSKEIIDSHFKETARCETSRLRAILCLVSCLPQRMLHGNVKTFDVIFKKVQKESTRAVELPLEGHIFFFLVRNTILTLTHKGQRQISKLLIASLLLAAVSISFSKHKRCVRKQTVGNRFEFILFF